MTSALVLCETVISETVFVQVSGSSSSILRYFGVSRSRMAAGPPPSTNSSPGMNSLSSKLKKKNDFYYKIEML